MVWSVFFGPMVSLNRLNFDQCGDQQFQKCHVKFSGNSMFGLAGLYAPNVEALLADGQLTEQVQTDVSNPPVDQCLLH